MKPATTSWLMLKPIADTASNPEAIDSGIEIITITEARQPKR